MTALAPVDRSAASPCVVTTTALSPRIVVVDSHLIVRQMIAEFLTARLRAEVCGECGTCAEAARLVEARRPDVALVEWLLPDGHAYDLLLRGRRERWPTRFVVLTSTQNPSAAHAAISAGAAGFVLKRSGAEALVDAIRHARDGTCFLCPVAASLLARAVQSQDEALSRRETEVLRLLADGRSAKQIAGLLGTSPKTVNNQLGSLKEKLRIWETAGLVRHAIESGLC